MNTPDTPLWHMQQAAQHFDEVVERALSEGPQTVLRHGKAVVRVVAVEEQAQSSAANEHPRNNLVEFLFTIPKTEDLAELIDACRSTKGIPADSDTDEFMTVWLSTPKIEGGLPTIPRESEKI